MLKKLLFLSFLPIIFSTAAFCFTEENLSDLEYLRYGTNYPQESLGERLNRLETDYFGMSQTGDINDRINNLFRINQNQGIVFPEKNAYLNQKSKNKRTLRSFWNNLTSGFFDDGYMTGFTPSMNTFSSYGFNDNNYGNGLWNNSQNFCPYPNYNKNNYGYFNNNYPERNFRGINSFNPNGLNRYNHYPYRRFHRNPQYYNNYPFKYPNTSGYINRYYTPPNFQTQSSIHILKD